MILVIDQNEIFFIFRGQKKSKYPEDYNFLS